MKKFNKFLEEANKSGDASLHDWFTKSKSSDGKPGWVQLGGRYAGKSCAKQPGQTTKPKCGSSKMAASMSDKEEDAAAKRKRAQDPDPNRSGAPINVSTEGKRKMKEEWSQKYKSSINCSHPKGFSQKAHCAGKKKQNESTEMEMTCEDCGMCQTHGNHSHDTLGEACWAGYEKKGMKTMFGKRYPNCVKKESIDEYIAKSECPECGGLMVSEDQLVEEKDACYHKVKSRYSVWPSAYASGALVKCRKAGAANWGNKTKQEGTQLKTFKQHLEEATYQGKEVALNKPMAGDVKKSKVYVDPDGDGKAQKVNFGDKNLSIKKDQPKRKSSYCARSGGIKGTSDKTSANYWSRRAWDC
jgi:hypothetical protein